MTRKPEKCIAFIRGMKNTEDGIQVFGNTKVPNFTLRQLYWLNT